MGYILSADACQKVLEQWRKDCVVYAPKRFTGGGAFSGTDCIRYGEITQWSEVVFDEKSAFSFKEVLTPITQILFYFNGDRCETADAPKKGAVVFLRACDIHAVKRLDEIYLRNGAEDPYYRQLRKRITFVLMGCPQAFESCFCTSMGTNHTDEYAAAVSPKDGAFAWDCKYTPWDALFQTNADERVTVVPAFVTEVPVTVSIPENLSNDVMKSEQWAEYDSRCIGCGRCNFVCPTCTCFTMQDIFYTDNGRLGERRRVWSSCMVDGFTDVAGGGSYRKENGQRMRFKALHKALDFKQRFGYSMCVGCGRCDDVCPEYISFSHILNRLESMMEEVQGNAGKE